MNLCKVLVLIQKNVCEKFELWQDAEQIRLLVCSKKDVFLNCTSGGKIVTWWNSFI